MLNQDYGKTTLLNLSDCVKPGLGKTAFLTELSDCVQPGLGKTKLLTKLSDCVKP